MFLSAQFPPWAMMWILAVALYASAKVATLVTLRSENVPASRKLAYLFLFPGMNAAAFCAEPARRPVRASPVPRYAVNILIGCLLLWTIARLIPQHPLVQGWIGMTGFILMLHFGLLQFPALAWQVAGYRAPPLMDRPICSASLTEFWGLRWNTAFHQLSSQFLFRPIARHSTPAIGLLGTFAISGAIHDLVISLPAGAGFGLPTSYFLIQGVGVLFERAPVGKRLLRSPLAARCFALAVAALPAPLLFHPAFVMRVFLPFMCEIGALPKGVYP